MNSNLYLCAALITAYLIVGIALWIIGINQFRDGDQGYMDYIRKDLKMSIAVIPIIFIVFIFTWPIFIRRRR